MSSSLQILAPLHPGFSSILTPAALDFLTALHRKFEPERERLLKRRADRQVELDNGAVPTFLPETAHIRSGDWKGPAHIPDDLKDRRVEITGPPDRKMIINALNSPAKVFMADFEDASAPTWFNMIDGQINLKDAIARTISFKQGDKQYKLKQSGLAVLFVRPRGFHLPEAHIHVDGKPMSGSFVDFGLFFFHNAKQLISMGTGPYFYLPKMESHLEARLWNSVFVWAQQQLAIPVGTIRATVLIETILGAFEMEEILYELRTHSCGLNCGRWDYIFSVIKKFRSHSKYLLPDRAQVTMDTPFMANYVKLLVEVCHKRGVHAMGGMAAQIPVPKNQALNEAAMKKVENDKMQEVKRGHDGTWVAHPGLIPVALKVFDQHMKGPNQLSFIPKYDRPIVAADLLDLGPRGTVSMAGISSNIDVAIRYTEAWLRGNGCVPLHNLMEDAATAEIARCQLWQWLAHQALVDNKQKITKTLMKDALAKEAAAIKQSVSKDEYERSQFPLAIKLIDAMIFGSPLEDFLTSAAYPYLIRIEKEEDKKKQPKSKL